MSLPVSEISAVSANPVLDRAAARPESLDALADKFGRMMETQPPEPSHTVRPAGEASAVQHFVSQQEHALQQTFDDVRAFQLQAPSMNMQTLAARQMQLTQQMAMVQLQFNAGVYVAQSSKTGLQTLMKNQ